MHLLGRRSVCAALVLGSLLLSGCVWVVSEPVYGPGGHEQRNPSVAFDGTNFLAVWADVRQVTPQHPFDANIYGARIRPDGSVLDVTGIPITSDAGGQDAPDVAFDGTNFLVVWTAGSSTYGARVSPAGVVLDPQGFIIGSGERLGAPAVSAGAGSSLVVWETCVAQCSPLSPSLFETVGKRVSASGVVLDPTPIEISSSGLAFDPDVAFDGTHHLVVWQQANFIHGGNDVFARRVSSAGTVVESAFAVTSRPANEASPAVAFDGTNFLAVWTADPVSILGKIRGARITPGAVVLDGAGFNISTARGGAPTVIFDGTNHFVAWASPTGPVNDDDPLLGRRVSSQGSLVDSAPLSLGQGLHPTVAAGAGTTLLTFESAPIIGFLRPAAVRADADQWADSARQPTVVRDEPGERSAVAVDRLRRHQPSRGLGQINDPASSTTCTPVASDQTERCWMEPGSRSRRRLATNSTEVSRSTGQPSSSCGRTARWRRRTTIAQTFSELV